jgi:hypothetical protein
MLDAVRWRHGKSKEEVRRPIHHLFLFIGAEPNTTWLSGSGVALDAKGFVLTGVDGGGRPLETPHLAPMRSAVDPPSATLDSRRPRFAGLLLKIPSALDVGLGSITPWRRFVVPTTILVFVRDARRVSRDDLLLRCAFCSTISQVMGREGFGEHPINPISPPTIMFDDLIDDPSHLSLLTLLSSLIVSQVSLSGCGRLLVGPSQKGMQNCHDLRALADTDLSAERRTGKDGDEMVDQHLEMIRDVTPSADGCEDCLRIGSRWVHLRLCLTCGHVGCCDSSPHRHARMNFHESGHPIIQSFEPGEAWRWCYVHEAEV